jgi:hypothetical protein
MFLFENHRSHFIRLPMLNEQLALTHNKDPQRTDTFTIDERQPVFIPKDIKDFLLDLNFVP